jgi:hypothetical protein
VLLEGSGIALRPLFGHVNFEQAAIIPAVSGQTNAVAG